MAGKPGGLVEARTRPPHQTLVGWVYSLQPSDLRTVQRLELARTPNMLKLRAHFAYAPELPGRALTHELRISTQPGVHEQILDLRLSKLLGQLHVETRTDGSIRILVRTPQR